MVNATENLCPEKRSGPFQVLVQSGCSGVHGSCQAFPTCHWVRDVAFSSKKNVQNNSQQGFEELGDVKMIQLQEGIDLRWMRVLQGTPVN